MNSKKMLCYDNYMELDRAKMKLALVFRDNYNA